MKTIKQLKALLSFLAIFFAAFSPIFAQNPSISGFLPLSARSGQAITISGANFDTTIAGVRVYFGGRRAQVTAASATSITALVPPGAPNDHISVLTRNRWAKSREPFRLIFAGGNLSSANFATPATHQLAPTTIGFQKFSMADMDQDGLMDVVVPNYTLNQLHVSRNTSTGSTINFAAPVTVAATNTPYASTCADFDNDGRPDVIVGADGSGGNLLIFRNTSTGIGNIQLGTPIIINLLSVAYAMKAADFNGDGLIDFAVSANNNNEIRVYQNVSTGPGNIAFSLASTVNISASAFEMEVGDLDGDGLEDIVCSMGFNNIYRILRNTSAGGSISFSSPNSITATNSSMSPQSIDLVDLNNDGRKDIVAGTVVLTALQNVSVPGNISFSPFVTLNTNSSYATDVEDLNGDGRFDIGFVPSTQFLFMQNNFTSGNIKAVDFSSPISATGFTSSNHQYGFIVDLNNDGYKDYISHQNGSNNFVSRRFIFTCSQPQVLNHPQPFAGCIGDSVGFNVSVIGNGNINYQWRKNGVPISGATSSVLIIDSLVAADSGFYDVEITDSCGVVNSSLKIVSNQASLILRNGPAFVTQPISQSICGGEFRLNGSLVGNNSTLSLQWRKDGVNLPGATSLSFRKATSTIADTGSYVLVATNSCGTSFSDIARITPFSLVSPPIVNNSSFCTSGSNVFLPASGVLPSGYQYAWYDDGALSTLLTNLSSLSRSYNQTDSLFIRFERLPSLSGNFSVNATSFGDDRSALAVTSTHVFYTTDIGVVRYRAAGLTNGTLQSIIRDGMFSSTAGNGILFSLGTSVDAWQTKPTTATHLWRLDSNLSVISGSSVPFTGVSSISTSGVTFIAANDSFALVFNGSGFHKINLFTGQVNIISISFSSFNPAYGENNQGWGALEIVNGNHYIVYRSNSTNTFGLSRYHVEGNTNVDLFNPGNNNVFSDLSTIVYSPWNNRYYYKLETGTSGTQSLGFDEVMGYCSNPVGLSNISCPSAVDTAIVVSNQITFNTQPASSVQACNGGNATFTVSATSGSLPVTYAWFRNALPISGATNATYTASAVTKSDSGAIYYASASSSCGVVNSNQSILRVNGSRILNQPQVAFNCPGEPVSFTITLSPYGTMAYQWFRNGSPVSGATSTTFSIASLTPSDTGLYTLRITDSCNIPWFSSATRVYISNGPGIIAQPAGANVCAGQTHSITVSALGVGNITYQWRKNGLNIPGATQSTLTFTSFAVADTGLYSVVISDNCGQVTSTAVYLGLAITQVPVVSNVSFCTAGNQNLFNTATLPLGYTVRWYDDRNLTTLLSAGNSLTIFRSASDTIFARTELATTLVSGVFTVERSAAGDDRGGIAVTSNYYYNVGDNATIRYRAPGLTNGTNFSIRDGIFATYGGQGTLYSFGTSTGPFGAGSSSISHIYPMDSNLVPIGTGLALSQSISASGGFVAPGPDFVILISGGIVYKINLQNGTVTTLSTNSSNFSYFGSENWASWGYTLQVGTQHHIIYRPSASNGLFRYIVETNSNLTEFNAGSFSPFSDMASIAFSPWNNRMYFHFEGGTTQTNSGPFSETAGYCSLPVRYDLGCPSAVDTILLTLNTASILQQPNSVTTCSFNPVRFIVRTNGINPTFQWRRNGLPITGAIDDTLFFPSVQTSDAGVYSVVITTSCGSVTSNNANLTVRGINFVSQPQSVRTCVGEPVLLTVQATGSGVLSYQWRKNGVPISGATGTNFTITSLSSADTAMYTVAITDSCGVPVISQGAQVSISTGPLITSLSSSTNVCVNTPITLTCSAQVSGTPIYQWQRNGVSITLPSANPAYTDVNFTAADTGEYKVLIIDQCGFVLSQGVYLSLYTPPTPTVNNGFVCVSGNTANMVNSGTVPTGFTTRWYDDRNLTVLLATGSSLNRIVTVSDTIFVRNESNIGSCFSEIDTVLIGVNANNTWNGITNTNWFNASNWSCGVVPNLTSIAIIPNSVPNFPIINAGLVANAGVLQLQAGATLTMLGNSTLNIGTSTQIDGVFLCPSGTVNFLNTSTAYTIGRGLYNNISVSANSQGASLSGTIRVNGTFTFSGACIVSLDTCNLVKQNYSIATTVNAGTNSYFRTNRTGSFIVPGLGLGSALGTSTLIHVGNSSYNPISIIQSGALDTFSIRVLDSVAPAYVNGVPVFNAFVNNVVRRSWYVTETNSGGSQLLVSPRWLAVHEGTSFDRTNCYVSAYNAGWLPTSTPTNASLVSGMHVVSSGLTSTATIFGVGSNNALPVSWLSFNAVANGSDVELTWKTASEENSDYFAIERSPNGFEFETIGKVKAAGNTPLQSKYNYVDKGAMDKLNDAWYYRLRQVDVSGEVDYSETRVVSNSNNEENLSVYPNPFVNELFILNKQESSLASIQLMDAQGRLIQMPKGINLQGKAANKLQLPVDLASGVYLLRVETAQGKVYNWKITKQ